MFKNAFRPILKQSNVDGWNHYGDRNKIFVVVILIQILIPFLLLPCVLNKFIKTMVSRLPQRNKTYCDL